MAVCECGCGQEVKPGKRFIVGHNRRGDTIAIDKMMEGKRNPTPKPKRCLCGCGCGEYAKPGNIFVQGHQNIGRKAGDNTRKKMSGKKIGHPTTDNCRTALSKANVGKEISMEARKKTSATLQGIPYEEWNGFIGRGAYCEKFDEACRERVRKKYDRLCYVCDKDEDNNGRKLDVHHVDRNKDQGCNGIIWKLIPLCRSCHGKAHSDPMKSRLQYLSLIHNKDCVSAQTVK